jgi:hypothetical protein
MSTQLTNMKAEQQALKQEVDHIENAIPMPDVCSISLFVFILLYSPILFLLMAIRKGNNTILVVIIDFFTFSIFFHFLFSNSRTTQTTQTPRTIGCEASLRLYGRKGKHGLTY